MFLNTFRLEVTFLSEFSFWWGSEETMVHLFHFLDIRVQISRELVRLVSLLSEQGAKWGVCPLHSSTRLEVKRRQRSLPTEVWKCKKVICGFEENFFAQILLSSTAPQKDFIVLTLRLLNKLLASYPRISLVAGYFQFFPWKFFTTQNWRGKVFDLEGTSVSNAQNPWRAKDEVFMREKINQEKFWKKGCWKA